MSDDSDSVWSYHDAWSPPAPSLPVLVSVPGSPVTVSVRAWIDSGADISVVPISLARQLRLPRVGVVRVSGFRDGGAETPTYAASVFLPAPGGAHTIEVVADGHELLLGRDVLNHCRLLLDGPAGRLILLAGPAPTPRR